MNISYLIKNIKRNKNYLKILFNFIMDEKNFISAKVLGVYVTNTKEGMSPVVFLDCGEKVLPIYIGTAEAFSIQLALEKMQYPRPLTHDLLINILNGLDIKVEKIVIDDLHEGVFYARLILKKDKDEYEFDARPSDSIALALRTNAPIYVSKKVIDEAGVNKEKLEI